MNYLEAVEYFGGLSLLHVPIFNWAKFLELREIERLLNDRNPIGRLTIDDWAQMRYNIDTNLN